MIDIDVILERLSSEVGVEKEVVVDMLAEKLTKSETTSEEFEGTIKDLCFSLGEVIVRKNRDYQDSYTHTVDKYGDAAVMIRLTDKYRRVENLLMLSRERYVEDERIEDSLFDLAGYAILEVARRKCKSK